MCRILVAGFVSLNGVMEDPGGSKNTKLGGWTFPYDNDAFKNYKLDEQFAGDAY